MSRLSFVYLRYRSSRSCASLLATAALLFLALPSVLVSQSDPSNIDVRLFRGINNSRSQLLTSVVDVTDYSVSPIVVAAPIGLTLYGLAADRGEAFDSGVLLGSAEVISYSIRYILKVGFKRDRPYQALTDVHIGHLESADPYSFPSGHATGAFALATLLTLRYPRAEVYVPAFLWAGMVGYGRIYLGLHYPTDVLGGALIGAGSSLLVFHYQEKILPMVRSLIGKKASDNVSAIVVPAGGGAIMDITVRF